MHRRHSDGLLEEGLFGVVEAERLVDDVRLRFDAHRQDGDGLAVVRAEVAVDDARLQRVLELAVHLRIRLRLLRALRNLKVAECPLTILH